MEYTQTKTIARLHYLTQDDVAGYSHAALAEEACHAGVNWVQLRTKGRSVEAWMEIALQVKEVTDKYGATLIINDQPEIAKSIGAAGVHLGRNDMPVEEARCILGRNAIIGGTANNEAELEALLGTSVDYIGLGPYRYTETKKNLSPLPGWERLQEMISRQRRIPIILIGGIKAEDVEQISGSGAHGIAVSSAINMHSEKRVQALSFIQLIERSWKN